jgi:hypothetical protein
MKTTLKASRDKLKQLFAQHNQPQDEPITETPTIVGPEPDDPPPFDERAFTEDVARQVGWGVGDEVQATVSNRQILNKDYVWATVDGWSDLVLVSVHRGADWPAGSRVWCQYAKANSDGYLVFNTKERGPKWKRRAS